MLQGDLNGGGVRCAEVVHCHSGERVIPGNGITPRERVGAGSQGLE